MDIFEHSEVVLSERRSEALGRSKKFKEYASEEERLFFLCYPLSSIFHFLVWKICSMPFASTPFLKCCYLRKKRKPGQRPRKVLEKVIPLLDLGALQGLVLHPVRNWSMGLHVSCQC